jgi:hypothetical protein
MPTQDPKKIMKDLSTELAKVTKELDKSRESGGKKKGTIKELESGALNNILDALARSMDLVKTMLEKGEEDNCPRVRVLEEKTRALEDQSDHLHQRSLKGKFLISSLRDKNIIASEDKLKQEGKSTPSYVSELVYNKLGVRVKEEEITSCHHTSKGLLIFRLGDFKPGSSFTKIVTAIKSGAGKDVKDLFVNFALTPRRAALLYEARQLKKAKKITKFLTDSDGSITVVKTDGTKMKLTNNGGTKVATNGGSKDVTNGGPNGGSKDATKWSFGKTLTTDELRSRFVD